MRDRVWARRAFHLRYGHCDRVHADHFRDGFIAGYGNVCEGHGGECPALPPEKYWSYRYRSHEGAEMQNAWFAGFEAGAESARADGTTTFQEIQISRALEEAMLAADEMEAMHAGIRKEYIIDAAPVTEGASRRSPIVINEPMMPRPMSTPPSMSMPQANMPYIPDNQPPYQRMEMAPSENMPLSIQGHPASSPSGQPLPAKIIPAQAPVVPGQSR